MSASQGVVGPESTRNQCVNKPNSDIQTFHYSLKRRIEIINLLNSFTLSWFYYKYVRLYRIGGISKIVDKKMLCFLKMEKVKLLVCSPFGRNRIGIELKCQRRLLGWWTVIYISSDVTQKEKGEVGPAGTELLTKKQRERNSDKKRGILITTRENRTRNHEKEVRKSI